MQVCREKEKWEMLLSGDLPGEEAQLLMAPRSRGDFLHHEEATPAAVLILLYPSGNKTCLAMMKRNAYPGPHSAQVSFPGGRREASDDSLETTALRETREELGITGRISILGTLTELYIPVSNFRVTPFVGWMDQKPSFDPDPAEVQYVIESTVEALQNPRNCTSEIIFRHGQSMETPCYRIGTEKVWGATAMILSEFLQLASTLP